MILDVSNYHSPGANLKYLGNSQYKDFAGTLGHVGCESRAMAKLHLKWEDDETTPLLVGSYVDAHFSGTLDFFKARHRNIFKKDMALRAEFEKADEIIQRIERDDYFMECMSGEKQVIMTANLFGADWKIMIDSFHPDKAIVDLKVMRSINKSFWVKDYGKMNFIEFWGYDIQAAIYQEVVRINTGKQLPFLIAAATKEKVPNIEVIGFDQQKLNDVLTIVETNIPRIIEVKSGDVAAERCGLCEYCRHTKILSGPVHYSTLIESVN